MVRPLLILTFRKRRRFVSCLRRKCWLFLCAIFISISCIYLTSIPYDFTIGTLASIYDRCLITDEVSLLDDSSTTPKGEFSSWYYYYYNNNDAQNYCNNNYNYSDFTQVNNNSSIYTSRPPWIGVARRKMVAYSAYYLQDSGIVRVLVLKHMRECRPVTCYFHYNTSTGGGEESDDSLLNKHQRSSSDFETALPISPGTYDLIRLDCWWDCDYFESFFIDCPLSSTGMNDDERGAITSVSVIPVELVPCTRQQQRASGQVALPTQPQPQPQPWPRISMHTIPPASLQPSAQRQQQKKHSLTMCLGPLFNWTDALKFVLFVQYYLRQGATRFVIYHRSWSQEVQRVISYYSKQPYLDMQVIEWPELPPSVDGVGEEINVLNKHISYNGQVLAMNDCGLRERGRSRFVAHVDLDEFIFVFLKTSYNRRADHAANSSNALLKLLDTLDAPDAGSFIFDHVRVYSDLAPKISDNDSLLVDGQKVQEKRGAGRKRVLRWLNASTASFTIGRVDHFPSRSKTIVKPEAILKQGVHFVWKHELGYTKTIVPNERAVFYHMTSYNQTRHQQQLDAATTETVRDREEMAMFRAAIQELENDVAAVMQASGL